MKINYIQDLYRMATFTTKKFENNDLGEFWVMRTNRK